MPAVSTTSRPSCAQTGADNVEQVQSAKVSANFFTVLGTTAVLGRTLTAGEVNRNANLVVLSYQFWKRHYSSAADVIGKKLEIDNAAYQVIGVMPADFAFPAK